MKQQKLIKSFLATFAFVGGAVVAQYLEPLSGPVGGLGGLQEALHMAKADAAPLDQPPLDQPPLAQQDVLKASVSNATAENARVSQGSAAIEPAKVHPESKVSEQSSLHAHRAKRDGFGNQKRPDEKISTRLSLTALPGLSTDGSHRSIRWDSNGSFRELGVTAPSKDTPSKDTLDRKVQKRDLIIAPSASASTSTLLVAARQSAATNKAPMASESLPGPAISSQSSITKNDLIKTSHQDGEKSQNGTARLAKKTNEPDEKIAVPPESTDAGVQQSPELIALESKIKQAIEMYRNQTISVREKSAWSVMHSFIGYGVEKKVRIDQAGKQASAIGWICYNNPCRGVRLFYLNNNRIYGRLGPGNQGHEGQFMAMLAQSRVHTSYPMKIDGKDFTVADLVRREQETCRAGAELTFKLIGLSHYLDLDETWRDDRGGKWSVSRLVQEEMRQPIIGAACGGTHRLFGLSYAVNRCGHKGKAIEGQYQRAKIYVQEYQKYTFKMQNPDGSFSTRFFTGRGASPDKARRLLTTGHISEWLAFSLSDEELINPKMVKAMDYLATLLVRGQRGGWEVGPLGHALHALNIYNDRVFSQTVSDSNHSLAKKR